MKTLANIFENFMNGFGQQRVFRFRSKLTPTPPQNGKKNGKFPMYSIVNEDFLLMEYFQSPKKS